MHFSRCLYFILTHISARSRDHSSDTMRTRRSHRSPSRERDRHDRRRERGSDDKRRSSRSHERRDRRSRSRDKSHRDRDRERERDRDRRHRDRDHERHSHRDRDRDYERDRRRRRREEDGDDANAPEDRLKRKRGEDSADESSLPLPRDSPRRSSERAHSRDHYSDRRSRHSRDPRDEFDDSPRYGRDRGSRRDERRPRNDDDPPKRKPSPPPPLTYAFSSQFEILNAALIELYKYSRRKSPTYEPPPDDPMNDEPREDDSEARSVFVSQLAARLTARDLGYFFEDKLGENTVLDARIVTDRLSRRSKGSVLFTLALPVLTNPTRIGYVEFRTIDLVDKALSLSGTVVMGLPIMVQLTEAERNRLHPGDGYV